MFFKGKQINAQYRSQYWTSSTGSIFRLIRTPLALEWVSQSVKRGVSEWVSDWLSDWVSQSVRRGVSEWMSEWASEWLSQSVRRGVSEWVNESVSESVSESVRRGVSESSNIFSSGKSEVLKVAWQCIYLVVKSNRNSQQSVFVH